MTDYLTKERSSEEIRVRAQNWRTALDVDGTSAPDVAWILEAILPQKLIAFSLLPVRPGDLAGDHARTDFDPPTIWVDQGILRGACEGDPFARYVLAHELGHLDQHEILPKSRSISAHRYSKASKEMSAEWQADEFAFHFLCPAHIVQLYSDVFEVMDFCQVEEAYARRAFDQYVTFRRPRDLPKSVQEFLSSIDR